MHTPSLTYNTKKSFAKTEYIEKNTVPIMFEKSLEKPMVVLESPLGILSNTTK